MALDESTFEGECWRVVVLALCVFLLCWWLAKLSWFGGLGKHVFDTLAIVGILVETHLLNSHFFKTHFVEP